MERFKSDDDVWYTTQKGYNFEVDQPQVGDSKLSDIVRENDELNQPDILRHHGLTEVAENRSARDIFASNILLAESEINSSKLNNFNPLIIHQKLHSENDIYGPELTVKSMIFGSQYSLERFKSKFEKSELLKAAVKSHDGNTILEVILFLRDTLRKSIFLKEIVTYNDAVNVYLAYLEEDHETDEHANMLLQLKMPEDAAILKYETAIAFKNPERKLKWIENCLSTHFVPDETDALLRHSIEEHKQILSEQIKLKEYHVINSTENGSVQFYEKLTGKKNVIDSSILCSFIFCCICYCTSGQPSFASAEKIKSNYNLTKKQYTWASVRVLAVSKKWSNIENLFTSKNWLGSVKLRSCIAFSRILEVLYKAKAPKEILDKYISCIENEEEKLSLAKKYGCHNIAIEVLKNCKDRQGLMDYKSSLVPHSVEYGNVIDILNNTAMRWKN